MKINKSAKIFGLLITSSIIIGSCGTDPVIRSAQVFGSESANFQENTNKLADDIYDSCLRRVQYFRTDIARLRKLRKQEWDKCENLNKPAALKARAANQLVVDYMESIGKLASDDIVSFDDEFNNINNALKGLSIPVNGGAVTLPSGSVDTGTKIANFIFNWVTSAFRKGTLTEAITCTDQPLQTYTEGLQAALQEGYINGILQQELDQANNYYDDYAGILYDQNGSGSDFNNLSKESYSAIVPILQRRNAALSYISIIKKTANTHAELAKLFLDGREPPSESTCSEYFAQSKPESRAISPGEKNNKQAELSPEQLTLVSQILISYQNEVEPLLTQMEKDLQDK